MEKRPKERAALQRELDGPFFPAVIGYLWTWYLDLEDERDYAGMGAALPIKAAQRAAWAAEKGHRLRPFEVEVLKALDRVCLRAMAESG